MKALLPSYGATPARNGQSALSWLREAVPEAWRSEEPVPVVRSYESPTLDPKLIGASAAGGAFTMAISTGLPGALLGTLVGLLYKDWGWKKGATVGGVAGLLLGATLGAAGGVVAATERKKWV